MIGQLSLLGADPTPTTPKVRTRTAVAHAYGTTSGRVIAAEKRVTRAAGAPLTREERTLRTEIALLHEALHHVLACEHEGEERCPTCTAHLASLSRCAHTPTVLEEHEAIVDAKRLARRLTYAEALERSVVELLRSIQATRPRGVGSLVWESARHVVETLKESAACR